MKLAALAATTAILASSVAFAEGVTTGSSGVSVDADLTSEYNTDSGVMTLTLSPELLYTLGQVDLTAGTDIAIYKDAWVLGDDKPTFDFKASTLLTTNLEVYGKVTYNADTSKRGDMIVGATFSF